MPLNAQLRPVKLIGVTPTLEMNLKTLKGLMVTMV